jgi:hypothetical protein
VCGCVCLDNPKRVGGLVVGALDFQIGHVAQTTVAQLSIPTYSDRVGCVGLGITGHLSVIPDVMMHRALTPHTCICWSAYLLMVIHLQGLAISAATAIPTCCCVAKVSPRRHYIMRLGHHDHTQSSELLGMLLPVVVDGHALIFERRVTGTTEIALQQAPFRS